jgi:amino acid adenylation domain-containing protein
MGPSPQALISSEQHFFWALHRAAQDPSTCNGALGVRITGRLNRLFVREALSTVVRQHPIYRTVYRETDAGLTTEIRRGLLPACTEVSLESSGEEFCDAAVADFRRRATRPFDLEREAPFSVHLYDGLDNHSFLGFVFHHVVSDGSSYNTFWNTFARAYELIARGQKIPPPDPDALYENFVKRRMLAIRGRNREASFDYWTRELKDASGKIEFPADSPSPHRAPLENADLTMPLDHRDYERAGHLALEMRSTKSRVLLASYFAWLHRFFNLRDAVVGNPFVGRTGVADEKVLGCCVSMLAIRQQMSSGMSFRELLRAVDEKVSEALDHSDVHLLELAEHLGPDHRGVNDFYNTTFQYRNVTRELRGIGDLETELVIPRRHAALYPLMLEVFPQRRNDAFICLTYDTNAFRQATADHFLKSYHHLLVSMLERPDRTLASHGLGSGGSQPSPATEPAAIEGAARLCQSPDIPHRAIAAACRLSFAQERLWFLDQYEPGSPLYNIPDALRLKGNLDTGALRSALNKVVARHEVLRTTCHGGDEYPVQIVNPEAQVEISDVDLRFLSASEREVEAGRLMKQYSRRPFVLSRDLMLRAHLLRLDEQEHILLLVVHHIASDGWSMGVLRSELHALYNGYYSGESPALPELPVQYADYARWQRERMAGETFRRNLAYWEERLSGCPSVLQLPTDRPRPAIQTFSGARESFDLGEELTVEMQRLARSQAVTSYMVLLAAFQALLYRYTAQQEILVGSPIAGRTHQEIESSIGFFVNTLVQRSDFSSGQTFVELLSEVRRTALESYEHQELPFEKLVDAIQPERSLSHSPLVQVMFVFKNTPATVSEFRGLDVQRLRVSTDTAKFDLLLSVDTRRGSLQGELEYNSDLFDATTARRIVSHYRNLLTAAVREPSQELSRLPLLSQAETHRVLVEWNSTAAAYPRVCLHTQLERQVLKTPDTVALEFEGRSRTYQELDKQANGIAGKLRQAGVKPGSLVGILLERSVESVAAVLGTLKAGAAYVPLDDGQPPERLAFLVEDSGIELLIAGDVALAGALPTTPRILLLDSLAAFEAEEAVVADVTLDDLLYVIYTSGSTGQPKGVAMPHRPLVNLLAWQETHLKPGAGQRVAQLAPLSFDVSCQEVFSTLTTGGTLVIVPERLRRDPAELWRFLCRERIERLYLPFVSLEQLAELAVMDGAPPLREVICAGEQLRVTPSIRRLFARLPGCKLINHYGPTETHVVTGFELMGDPHQWPELPAIGRPIANTQVYVLDAEGQPCPVGVPGELYIGGHCLARGYLGRPDLTDERFVENRFAADRSPRLYRTGDLARYLPDGTLLFLGRNDDQVKIRGYRVELGEVETALARHAGVDAVAVAVQEEAGFNRLVAYVVPAGEQSNLASQLRELTRRSLPDYMFPAAYVFLDQLPLTRTGKVDRGALPVAEGTNGAPEVSFIAPRTETERGVAQIWEELLGVRPIGVGHDFFELGGHSLMATRMVLRLENKFGQRITLVDFFNSPTIEGVAALLGDPPPSTATRGQSQAPE